MAEYYKIRFTTGGANPILSDEIDIYIEVEDLRRYNNTDFLDFINARHRKPDQENFRWPESATLEPETLSQDVIEKLKAENRLYIPDSSPR